MRRQLISLNRFVLRDMAKHSEPVLRQFTHSKNSFQALFENSVVKVVKKARYVVAKNNTDGLRTREIKCVCREIIVSSSQLTISDNMLLQAERFIVSIERGRQLPSIF